MIRISAVATSRLCGPTALDDMEPKKDLPLPVLARDMPRSARDAISGAGREALARTAR
jgi:hypothetical protein